MMKAGKTKRRFTSTRGESPFKCFTLLI